MKSPLAIHIAIGFASVLTAVIIVGHITQNAYAAVSSSGRSSALTGSLRGANGVTTGTGSNVGDVNPNLFCKGTGVITPICK